MTLIGNLGHDPSLRYGESSGAAVCRFSLAVTERRGGEEKTEWFNVVCFGKTAESAHQYLAKGKQAYVDGRLQTRKYQDKKGQDRQAVEILADRVVFLGSRTSTETGSDSPKNDDNHPKHHPQPDDPFSGDFGPPPNDDELPF